MKRNAAYEEEHKVALARFRKLKEENDKYFKRLHEPQQRESIVASPSAQHFEAKNPRTVKYRLINYEEEQPQYEQRRQNGDDVSENDGGTPLDLSTTSQDARGPEDAYEIEDRSRLSRKRNAAYEPHPRESIVASPSAQHVEAKKPRTVKNRLINFGVAQLQYELRRQNGDDVAENVLDLSTTSQDARGPEDAYEIEDRSRLSRKTLELLKEDMKFVVEEFGINPGPTLTGLTCAKCERDYSRIYLEKDQLVKTSCGHIFCDMCALYEIVIDGPACPTCGEKVTGFDNHVPDCFSEHSVSVFTKRLEEHRKNVELVFIEKQ